MSTEQEKPVWKCAGCAHPPHGICLAGRGEVCRCLGQPENDVVCQHGTAADVHCCNCHSGFVFDHTRCVCGSASAAPPAGAQGETPAGHRYSGQALAEQAGACMVLKAFLKKQAMHTSNLRYATSYAEAAAIIDAYLNALTDVHRPDGLLDQAAQQAEEIARLRAERDEWEGAAILNRKVLAHHKQRAEAAESQVQALQAHLSEAQQRIETLASALHSLIEDYVWMLGDGVTEATEPSTVKEARIVLELAAPQEDQP